RHTPVRLGRLAAGHSLDGHRTAAAHTERKDPQRMNAQGERIPATVELGDSLERELRACELQLTDFGGRTSSSGRIVSFRTPGDNLQLKDIVRRPGEGRVIVVDAGGDLSGAMIGD